MKLKKILEEKNAKIEEMEKIIEKMGEEERAEMSEQEQMDFDKLEKEVRAFEETISRLEKLRSIDIQTGSKNKEEKETEERAQAEEKEFLDYVKGKVTAEQRADTNMTFAENGAVVPASIANKIIEKLKNVCPIYELSTRYNVKGTLSIPYYNEETGTINMAYAEEFSELEASSAKFTSITMTGFLAGALSKVPRRLLNNSDFMLLNYIVSKVAESAKLWIEKECLQGTNGKIEGLKGGVTQAITSKSTVAITADELMDVQDLVHDSYQEGAIWIMNKKTRTSIRQLKDGQGNYLLERDFTAKWNYTLLGKPVYVTDNMPEIESGKTAIYYGDMSGLATKVVEDVNIQVLYEKYATQHAVGIVAWMEADAKVENVQKLSALKIKTA